MNAFVTAAQATAWIWVVGGVIAAIGLALLAAGHRGRLTPWSQPNPYMTPWTGRAPGDLDTDEPGPRCGPAELGVRAELTAATLEYLNGQEAQR